MHLIYLYIYMFSSQTMALYICKNLAFSLSIKNNSYLQKPHFASLLNVLFFSTKIPKSPTTDVSSYLINQHCFSPERASKVSCAVKRLKSTETTDSVFCYLHEIGFSGTHLEELVTRVPRVLSADLDRTIKPKIDVFRELGFTKNDVLDIVAADPWILTRSADNMLGPSILGLKSVLGSNANVSKLLKLSGWFLKYNLEKTMMPNIKFLKECGISLPQLMSYVYCFPRFFLQKPENIKQFVKRVDEMGCDRKSKMYLHAIRVLSSMSIENWELKLKLFRDMGFSEDDILALFRKAPQVFAVSRKKIMDVTQFLVSSGKFDLARLVDYPELLIYSVEQRLKPRLTVLKILESKNLPKRKPSLTTICKISKQRFLNKYVLPYSEVLGDQLKLWIQS